MDITSPVRMDVALVDAQQHRFGLSLQRWSSMKGQRFWLTGAGTGFGRCIALGLLAAGATVLLSSRREELLRKTLLDARDLGFDTEGSDVYPLDLYQPAQIEEACRQVAARFGIDGLDGLIHSAALPGRGPCTDSRWEDWDALLTPNVRSAWYLVQQAFPAFLSRKKARVLLLGSEAGWSGGHGVGLYSVSKAALNGLTQALANEYGRRYPEADLQINLLNPGEAATEMNRGSTDSPEMVVSMALLLLSHPGSGPNGCFFHRDGRHLDFGSSPPHPNSLA